MNVDRLSRKSLEKILGGQVKEKATCVVKFYSNSCPFCSNLKDYFEDIAKEEGYSDLHFFAFNVDDYPSIEDRMKFNGVPTISLIKARPGKHRSRFRIMPDPDSPNPHTWYSVGEIKKFIEREK